MTTPSTRGAYAKGRARREQILTEAVAMFGETGYHGASLRDLAQRCGISLAGLLHHVGDKQSLLLAVLAHRDELDTADLGPATDGPGHLLWLVDVVRRNVSRRGVVELFCVLSAEATAADHPAHDFFVQRYARTVGDLTTALQGCGHPAPASAARRLVALMDGLQVQWLLDPAGVDMVAEVEVQVARELALADGSGPS